MRSEPRRPVRTVDDLRGALMALERLAPDAEAVLRAVREAAAPRRWGVAQPLRSPRVRRWLRWPRPAIGIAAAAAAAAVAITVALLAGGASSHIAPRHASVALPSAASVGKTMLASFSAINDDVLYSTQTGATAGAVVDAYRDWSWPAQPVAGGRELVRGTWSQRPVSASGMLLLSRPLKLTEDDGFAYLVPQDSANNAYGKLTVVCYAGTGQTGCGYDGTTTPPGTWSLRYGRFGNPNPGLDDLRPAALAQEITKGLWRVTRRSRVHGQQAIELTETPTGHYQLLPTLLWVNAHTYLPLRMLNGAGTRDWAQMDWYYLRPTPAHLALLRVPIPPGYPRSGG
jgi:hypothetical protein